MRVIVMGANGQLGGTVVRMSRAAGLTPVSLVRRPTGHPDHVVLPQRDWTAEGFRRLFGEQGIEAVVNLAGAGVRPGSGVADLFEANVELPVRMVQAGRGQLRAFVNIGSGAEYSGNGSAAPLGEDAPLTSGHPYGLSKAAGGLALRQVAEWCAVPAAHLRLFGMFGEGEADHRLLPSLARALNSGEAVPLSDGGQVRDWLYEEDIGEAIAAALRQLGSGRMEPGFYNLGSGIGHTVRQFALVVAAAIDAPAALLHFGALPRRESEVQALVPDVSKFASATAWTARHSFESGITTALQRLGVQRRAKAGGTK